MANLNGHEVGNDGYSQEEPVATAPMFYPTRFIQESAVAFKKGTVCALELGQFPKQPGKRFLNLLKKPAGHFLDE